MTGLATVEDLNNLQGTNFPLDDPRALALIEYASQMVRAEARQTFDLISDDPVVLPAELPGIWLPERPLIDVTAVATPGPPDAPWTLNTGEWTIREDNWIVPIREQYRWWEGRLFNVTYSHGYAEIPSDVVMVVCNVVGRQLSNPGQEDEETIGGYQVVHSRSRDIASSMSVFSQVDRKYIRNTYRRQIRSMRVNSIDDWWYVQSRLPEAVFP